MAGMSIATVSRVMNGATNVTPETREKVLAVSRELNYVPNAAARALSTSKSRTLATIIANIEHSIYSKFVASVEEALAERDYSLVLAISGGDPELEYEAARKLLGMGAEGFILSGGDQNAELTEMFESRGIPYLLTSIWDPSHSVPTVGYDNFALARQAIGYLRDQGHAKLAVLHGPPSQSDRMVARIEGAKFETDTSLQVDFFEAPISVTGGKSVAQSVLDQGANYTAILCFSDVLALGTYFAAESLGLSIPGDISVMGFDNLDWSTEVIPPLTTVNLPARKMGRAAAKAMMDCLDDGSPLTSLEFEGTIIERGSVAKRG